MKKKKTFPAKIATTCLIDASVTEAVELSKVVFHEAQDMLATI